MCKFCTFNENELGNTGEIWFETDDAGEVCGELCIMKHGYRSFWLCTPDYYTDRKTGKPVRCCPMVARIKYCPMCGRNLLEDNKLEQLRQMVRILDKQEYKSLEDIIKTGH